MDRLMGNYILYKGKGCGRIGIWQLYLLGAILLGAFAVYQIVVDPITWDSAVAVGLFLIAVLPGVIVLTKKWKRKRTLFKPAYQSSKIGIATEYRMEAAEHTQHFRLTLRMELETQVEFIVLMFDGQGILPLIQNLYDWRRDKENRPHYIDAEKVKERWYWRYDFPEHRLKGSSITIGCEYKATECFEGYLVIQLTCVDGFKEQRLPFKILKISTGANTD